MEDEGALQINEMTWYNILKRYCEQEIFGALEVVLRKFKSRRLSPTPAEYEEVILEQQKFKKLEIEKMQNVVAFKGQMSDSEFELEKMKVAEHINKLKKILNVPCKNMSAIKYRQQVIDLQNRAEGSIYPPGTDFFVDNIG